MNDRNLLRGLFLLVVAVLFGAASLRYPIGHFDRAGPGLFPLVISGLLLLIAVSGIVRSRLVASVPMRLGLRNIALVLTSLCGFALLSHHVNMILGIVFMVFCSSLAATSRSLSGNLKVSAGLVAMAFAFQYLLGLSLPLY